MQAVILLFALGVLWVQQLPGLPHYPVFTLGCLIMGSGMAGVAAYCWPRVRRVLMAVLSVWCGAVWAMGWAHYRLADSLPADWQGKDIQLVGVVASMPQSQQRGDRFLFDVEKVETAGVHVPRRIVIGEYFYSERQRIRQGDLTFHAGERWHLTVRLKRPHGTVNPHGFDFEAWALERNIRASGAIRSDPGNTRLSRFVLRPGYMVERARESIGKRMIRVLHEQEYAGILVALVIGDDHAITPAQWDVFRRTGVIHLMSISGLHITMVAGLVFALVNRLWRRSSRLTLRWPAHRAATLFGFVAATLYVAIAGFSVPTQRTFFMLLVLLLALLYNRAVSLSLVLSWALLAVLLWDPWAVMAPGFWLSFGAVALLVYVTRHRLHAQHWLREAVRTQWAVTIGLLPLLLLLFQQASVVSPLANAVAIPVISLLVTPLALIGAVIPLDFILYLAHVVMSGCMQVLTLLSGLPDAVWQQHVPPLWVALVALPGVLWLLLPHGFPLRWMGIIPLLPLFWIMPEPLPFAAVKLVQLDVGQGLAVVIQTSHHTLLYDAGPAFSRDVDSGSRIVVPYLHSQGVVRLDGLIVTHDDKDHTGGVASVLQAMHPAWVLSSFPVKGVPEEKHCLAGQSWQWDGVQFDVLHPDQSGYDAVKVKDNNLSCVLKVTTPGGRILLTSDIERKAERALMERQAPVAAEVLLVPHHGSATSSSMPFIEAVAPQVAIFSAGYRNRFKHPRDIVLGRYQLFGAASYRSDRDGAVVVNLQPGHDIKVRAWRSVAPKYWYDKNR